MKKTILLFMLFCVSVLCCFADENIESSPLFPFSGLSVPTLLSTDNTLTWKQVDFDITKYSEPPERKNFFEATSPVLPLILATGGFIALISGPFIAASPESEALGWTLTVGGIFTSMIGILWLVFTW